LKNDELEKALEETWKNKEKFYEETKELSMAEIIKNIENKYQTCGTAHNKRYTLRRLSAARGYVR
jgi:hypothetical protein